MKRRVPALSAALILLIALAALIVTGRVAGRRPDPDPGPDRVQLPVLLFHHIDETGGSGATIDSPRFERIITGLCQAGYQAVSIEEVVDFVESGGGLPDKPVLITFDDGYESNILLAAPILIEYGMQATVFVIGASVGKQTYGESEIPIIPHFSWEQAREHQGVISVQSHSFDMHQEPGLGLDVKDLRCDVLQLAGESDEEYKQAFSEDFLRSKKEIEENLGGQVIAFAYPRGRYSELSETLLGEMGVKITFTTEPGLNTLERDRPLCLFAMKRIDVSGGTDPDRLMGELQCLHG